MIRDLSAVLKKGNLTAKERALLLIHNAIEKDKTGKEVLTSRDKDAISGSGWKPVTNAEIETFNKYLRVWEIADFTELDAQTMFLLTQRAFENLNLIRFYMTIYPVITELELFLDRKLPKIVTKKQAEDIKKAQREAELKEGERLDWLIKVAAFGCLDKKIQEEIKKIYPDIPYEPDEIEDDIKIAELYRANRLEELAELISKHFAYKEEIEERCIKQNRIKLNLTDKETKNEVSRYEARREALEQYAKDNNTTVAELLKTTTLSWLRKGMLEKPEFQPLSLQNLEIPTKWQEAFDKAEKHIKNLISQGKLTTFKDDKGEERVTGESLHNLKGDDAFDYVQEFRDFVDRYKPYWGIVVDEKGDFLDRDLAILDSESEEDLKFMIDEKGYFNNRFLDSLHKLLDLLKITKIVNGGEWDKKHIFKGPRTLDWKDDFKDDAKVMIQAFIKSYEKLLAYEDVLKKVSKALEIDVAYKVNHWTLSLKMNAKEYNDTLERALSSSQPTLVEKRFQSKENLYINIEQAKADRDTVRETIKHFEAVLGNRFWEVA